MAQVVMVVAAVASALSSIRQGEQQKQAYEFQGQQAALQGRQNALNYNRQALTSFERQQRLAGTIRARAAAGGIDPLTGSPLSLDQWNAQRAGNEMQIARENADLSLAGGLAQSQQLYGAGDAAQQAGYLGAIGKGAMAYAMYDKSASPAAVNLDYLRTG